MDKIMHFVASCNFSDDEYLLGRQYAAAPSVDRHSDPVTETAFTGCARAPAHCVAALQLASFVAVVIGALGYQLSADRMTRNVSNIISLM